MSFSYCSSSSIGYLYKRKEKEILQKDFFKKNAIEKDSR
jgi:hypothetical protein